MPSKFYGLLTFALLALLVAAPSAAAEDGTYLVVFKQSSGIPGHAAQSISDAGGTVVTELPQIGVAIASSTSPTFAQRLHLDRSVATVGSDAGFTLRPQWIDESQVLEGAGGTNSVLSKSSTEVTDPSQAPFFVVQWNMRQVEAPAAWDAGHLGSPDVTVAVLESGIDYTHPELQGKVDLSRSVSFVPEDDAIVQALYPGVHPSVDLNIGGTMVAGIIACNATGTACLAPNVQLTSVKTVDKDSNGTWARHLQGILYAADSGVDILAASFGHTIHSDNPEFKAVRESFKRAVNYAWNKGIFVVGGIGGVARASGHDADHDVEGSYYPPAQFTHALGVSATAPINFSDFDTHSGYSNFGYTLVDLAAPGGRLFAQPFDRIASPCTQFSQVVPTCQINDEDDEFDWLLFASGNFAMGHAAGLAALLLSQDPSLTPNQIAVRMKQTADDLGDPGRDALFGWGRINVRRALE